MNIHTRNRTFLTLILGAIAIGAIAAAAPEAAAGPGCHDLNRVIIPNHAIQRCHIRVTERTVNVMINKLEEEDTARTVAISGLTTEETVNVDDKVPALGNLPALGRLFKNKGAAKEKQNLIILVTPTIVESNNN